MASENETVEAVIIDVKRILDTIENNSDGCRSTWRDVFDRIEAAHRREVAELRECLKEALWQRCTVRPTFKCKDCAYEEESCSKWRKVLEGANAPVAEGGES